LTRRDRITILLEYLIDVREGLPEKERVRGDEMIALMCEAWNSPAYQELERLLPHLRSSERSLYWHLCERFLRYGEVRKAWCRKCGYHHAGQVGQIHRHPPGRAITLQPRVIRTVDYAVDDDKVSLGIAWLEERYRGEAALPKAVLMCESERRLRVA
jgi:hypothetical protein